MKYYNKDVPSNKISLLSNSKRQIKTIMVKVPNCARTSLLRKPKTNISESLEGSVCSTSDPEEFEENPKMFNMDKTILINNTDTNQKTWDQLNERLQKRKLRNRIAARKARERTRIKMQKLEAEIEQLKDHTKALQTLNSSLLLENQKLLDKVKQHQTRKDPFILGSNEDFAVLEYDISDQKCGFNNFTSNYANVQESFADLFPDLNEVF